MKTAVLSNVNIDILPRFMERGAETRNFYIGPFNQYAQEMLDKDSPLYKFHPDLLILHIEGQALFEDIFFGQFSRGEDEMAGAVDTRINDIMQSVEAFAARCRRARIFLNTIALSPHTIGGSLETNSNIISMMDLGSLFNRRLKERKLALDPLPIFIADFEKVIFREGFGRIYDARYWYLGRMPYTKFGFEKIACLYASLLSSVNGCARKAVILDLDNTLWKGIVGEDGPEGIDISEEGIGKAYRDFQKILKAVKDKGILLAVVSKNNPEDVREVFLRHPMMVLREEDFVSVKVNWREKRENMYEIAAELNLGLDSFVFIDDSAVEREMVRKGLPEVAVPDFPHDAAYLVEWFSEISDLYFNKAKLTNEDRKRTLMYRADAGRSELSRQSLSKEDFLKGLSMKAVIYKNNGLMLDRSAQLTQRTNQFNLRAKRYGAEELAGFAADKNCRVWNLELIDKFGTNGVVGLMIARINDDLSESFLDTFLMSCRVIGRGVEKAFMNYAASALKNIGVREIVGEYLPIGKNRLVKDIYAQLGFRKIEERPDESSRWLMNLAEFKPDFPEYIAIVEKDE